jgi:CheY-like chemotaxis protein
MLVREQLILEVRNALLHLDDPVYLESHPLARRLSFVAQTSEPSRGQLLRRTLRLAIEALDPGVSTPISAPDARSYQVLHRYAIAKQSIIAIARQLDISERQAYRALRRATEAVAQMLFPEDGGDAEGALLATPRAPAEPGLREALDRLSAARDQQVDIIALVRDVVESVRPLAESRGIEIVLSSEAQGTRVASNRVILRQAVLNLASHGISSCTGDRLVARVYPAGEQVCVEIAYQSQPSAECGQPASPYAVAAQLLDTLGLDWRHSEMDACTACISISIPLTKEHTVLIVDDNEGLVELFRRYLQLQPYRVYAARDYDQALEMMDSLQPDVMIVDVLMPERDGWEVLQALQTRDVATKTRFIVCSIINDPQLAAALGAAGFLHKPVDRAHLLQTIQTVLSSPT